MIFRMHGLLFIMLNCLNSFNEVFNTWLVVYHAELHESLLIMLNCMNRSNEISNTWLVVYPPELLWFDYDMDLACFNCGYLSKKYLGCVCLNTCEN